MISREWVVDRLRTFGFTPKKALGQNFLIHNETISAITRTVSTFDCDLIIEIGPGLGSLTESLVNLNKPLMLIEYDKDIASYWKTRGLDCLVCDALHFDWIHLPSKTVLVSNLPYQIAARLVIEICLKRPGLLGMVLMFQKEVAQKLRAPRGESCLLSILSQTFWVLKKLKDLGPEHFYPSPKVRSEVLRFIPREASVEPNALLGLLKVAFSAPRRQLKNNLLSAYPRDRVEDALTIFPEKIRPSDLGPDEFSELLIRLALGVG